MKGGEPSGTLIRYELTEIIRLYFSSIYREIEDGKLSFCSFTARALLKGRRRLSSRPSRLYRSLICEGL